jgi:glycosyltransferase involved in cell wall biosynthesis
MVRHLSERGGVAVYTKNVLAALFKRDRKNEYFLLHRDESALGRFAQFPNVTDVTLKASSKLLWDQFAVPRYLTAQRIDLVFNPKHAIPLRTKTKRVVVIHGAEQFAVPNAFKLLDRMYFTLANPGYCRAADAVITMTETGKRDIVRYMDADPKKIAVIPEAYNELCCVLPESSVDATLRRYDLPDRFSVFIGGMVPLKNFGRTLRAFSQLTVGAKQLVVIGFKRWKFQKDLDLVRELNLEKRVHFVGFIPDEDIPAFYNRAEVLLFPSLYEGFGIPVLEAMACGCPVVTSKLGCSPEVAGGAAMLVDPYDVESIRTRTESVIRNERLRQSMIAQGLQRCRDFSWSKTAAVTLELFESLFVTPGKPSKEYKSAFVVLV